IEFHHISNLNAQARAEKVFREMSVPAALVKVHRPPPSVPRRLFRQRAVSRIHMLGAWAMFEFVDELIRYHPDLEDEIDRRIDRYADLDPALLWVLGGDKFPA